jgi:hypothetical protein
MFVANRMAPPLPGSGRRDSQSQRQGTAESSAARRLTPLPTYRPPGPFSSSGEPRAKTRRNYDQDFKEGAARVPGSEVRVGPVAEVTRKWRGSQADQATICHSAALTADGAGRLRLARSQEPSVTRPRPAAKMSRLTRP